MNIVDNEIKGLYRLYRDCVDAYPKHIEAILAEDTERSPFLVTTVFADFDDEAANKAKAKTTYYPKDKLKATARYAWKHYHRVYRHLTSNLMTNFTRKYSLHPLTFDFLDLSCTRHGSKISLLEPRTPHIHSIYLVHRKTLERFEDLRRNNFQSIIGHPSMSALTSLHALPIESGTIHKVVSYAAKLLESPAASSRIDDIDLYNQFPIAQFERHAKRSKQYCQGTSLKNSGYQLRQRFSRS